MNLLGWMQSMMEGNFSVSQQEAQRMMDEDAALCVLDVRTKEEFRQGHIPKAKNLPLQSLEHLAAQVLPNPDQKILIYCRSGARAKTAVRVLRQMGYTDVMEFGGLLTWKGKLVK